MSKLKKERLNQMIEIALSYKQEFKTSESNPFFKGFKFLILKKNIFGLTFASLIFSCFLIPSFMTSRNFVDVNEINDYVTFRIIEDL